MRPIFQGASLVFLALAAFLIRESQRLKYYTEVGPGPGFFPFWLGIVIGILAIIWFVQATTTPSEPVSPDFFPRGSGLLRIVAIVGALIAFTLLVTTLGFQLTMLVFLLFLLFALGRQNVGVAVAVSVIGSFGLNYAFTQWLDVQLPVSSIEFLQNLGL